MLRSKTLYEQFEYFINKPYKQTIEEYPEDLPTELTDLRIGLSQYQAQKQLIEFKNELVWRLMNEKKQEEENLNNQLDKEAREELGEWGKLVEKVSNDLKKY